MQVSIDHIEQLNDVTYTYWLRPERRVRSTAGEFVELTLPHDDVDSRGASRWFTLSSSPTESLLAITTTFSNPGSSFKRALQQLKPGTSLHMSDPLGDFLLPKDPAIPLVFVARGIGITPVRSIAAWLRDTGERRNAHLVYAVSGTTQVLYADTFDTVFGDAWRWTTERIKGADVHIADMNALYFLAGPERMTKQLADELLMLDVPSENIVTDYFPGYSEVIVAEA